MKNQKLFDYMHQEHGVTLLESDMIEIRNIVLDAIKSEEEQIIVCGNGKIPKITIEEINYFPNNPESD